MATKQRPIWPIITTISILILAGIMLTWQRYPREAEVASYMQKLYPKAEIEVRIDEQKRDLMHVKVKFPSGYTDSISTPVRKKRVLPWHSYYHEDNLTK